MQDMNFEAMLFQLECLCLLCKKKKKKKNDQLIYHSKKMTNFIGKLPDRMVGQ